MSPVLDPPAAVGTGETQLAPDTVADDTRREFVLGGLSLGALLVAGCGDRERDPVGEAVRIEHKFGSTEVPPAPARVVTVGLTDQDAVLALGVKPVGVVDWYGDYPNAVWPWQQRRFGSDVPEVIGDTSGLRFEAIAALEPDFIAGLYSALTRDQYEKLSRIAPTVAQPRGFPDFGAPWQATTMTIGRALGRAARARQLIDGVEARFAETRMRYPEFEGSTVVVAGSNGPGEYFIYGPEDRQTRFLVALGFTIPRVVQDFSEGFGLAVSAERLDIMDQDLALWSASTTPELVTELEESRLYQGLPVARQGRDLFLEPDDKVLNGAITWGTVLSLPIAIDGLAPRLPAILDGDPATGAG